MPQKISALSRTGNKTQRPALRTQEKSAGNRKLCMYLTLEESEWEVPAPLPRRNRPNRMHPATGQRPRPAKSIPHTGPDRRRLCMLPSDAIPKCRRYRQPPTKQPRRQQKISTQHGLLRKEKNPHFPLKKLRFTERGSLRQTGTGAAAARLSFVLSRSSPCPLLTEGPTLDTL